MGYLNTGLHAGRQSGVAARSAPVYHASPTCRALAARAAPVIEAVGGDPTAQLPATEAVPNDETGRRTMSGSTRNGLDILQPLARAGVVAMMALAVVGCGGKKQGLRPDMAASQVTTIGVNSYLWRASLDALSFMPLLQTDSNGGVIVTDWYANPANPGERVKVTVTILDRDLRADALRVAASRQVAQAGGWIDAPVQAATVQKLEDIILTKARDLRRNAIGG